MHPWLAVLFAIRNSTAVTSVLKFFGGVDGMARYDREFGDDQKTEDIFLHDPNTDTRQPSIMVN